MYRKMKNSRVISIAMTVALLFCVFVCPHSAEGGILHEYFSCDSNLTLHDTCDGHDHDHHDDHAPEHKHDHHHHDHHNCELDSSHAHVFFNDSSSVKHVFNVGHATWCTVDLSQRDLQQHSRYLKATGFVCCHTYTVRHLHKIILRV